MPETHDIDDWPAPTEWRSGPFHLIRSNAGFGCPFAGHLHVGRKRATSQPLRHSPPTPAARPSD